MGVNHQLHVTAVKAAKGIRQFQLADRARDKDKTDRAVHHLDRGLKDFGKALDHLADAADDALADLSSEIAAGNDQMQKCLDSIDGGDMDRASKHYDKALSHYDMALDMLDV